MPIKDPLILNEDIVYVASPYQGFLDMNKPLSEIRAYALRGMDYARRFYGNEYTYFSPVLYFTEMQGHENFDRGEVMNICARMVSDPHVSLFIYQEKNNVDALNAIKISEGIFDEWMLKNHASKCNIFKHMLDSDDGYNDIHEFYKNKVESLQASERKDPVSTKIELELIKRGYI